MTGLPTLLDALPATTATSVRHAEEMKSRSFETNPTSDKVDCVRLKLISDDGVFELR